MADCKDKSCCSKDTCCGQELVIDGEKIEAGHPRLLIPELCSLMYHQGWVTGTGGGMSIMKEYVLVNQAHTRPCEFYYQDFYFAEF
jgi:hypothetical protein